MHGIVNGLHRLFIFLPGRNEIDSVLWKSIQEQNQEDFVNHYSTILEEFRPHDEKGNTIQVNPDKIIDIAELSAKDAAELVENTTSLEELEHYLQIEKARDKQRKSIIQAIEAKMEQHIDFNRKFAEASKG